MLVNMIRLKFCKCILRMRHYILKVLVIEDLVTDITCYLLNEHWIGFNS